MARIERRGRLVMQFHSGAADFTGGAASITNRYVFEKFGADKGGDVPVETEWVHNLKPLTIASATTRVLRYFLSRWTKPAIRARWRP